MVKLVWCWNLEEKLQGLKVSWSSWLLTWNSWESWRNLASWGSWVVCYWVLRGWPYFWDFTPVRPSCCEKKNRNKNRKKRKARRNIRVEPRAEQGRTCLFYCQNNSHYIVFLSQPEIRINKKKETQKFWPTSSWKSWSSWALITCTTLWDSWGS